jgi:hypothetical protein
MTGVNCQNKVVRGDDKCEHSRKEILTCDPSLLSAAILTAKQENMLVFLILTTWMSLLSFLISRQVAILYPRQESTISKFLSYTVHKTEHCGGVAALLLRTKAIPWSMSARKRQNHIRISVLAFNHSLHISFIPCFIISNTDALLHKLW